MTGGNLKATHNFFYFPLFACFVSGCASITGSEMQSLSVTAADRDGKTIEKADCVMDNDKGHWAASTPSFVMVHRSAEDLTVVCKKEGFTDGVLKAVSRASGSMFGNIIFGGGVGALIDHNSGNGYNYPDQLPVKMGGSVLVDRKDQGSAQHVAQGDTNK
ncbi:MAG: hypothetical protein PHR30_05050 [Gallionellaceae bacterium]|nr:hypothetical protein [Gallionellaceae bacterium]